MQKWKRVQKKEKRGFLGRIGRKIGAFFRKLVMVSALVFGLLFLGLWAGNSIWETKLDSRKGGSIIVGEKPAKNDLAPKQIPVPAVVETPMFQGQPKPEPKRDRIEFKFEAEDAEEVVEKPAYEDSVPLEPEFMRVVQKKGQYRVQENDTWYAVSKKFNVSRDDLYRVNDAGEFTIIRPGDLIWIPQVVMMAQVAAVSYQPTIFSKMRRSVGKELAISEYDQIARWAGGITHIRPELLMATLYKESTMGKNLGDCRYNQEIKGKPVMREREQSIFLNIVRDLNLHPNHVPVSCPNQDGEYAGAMGPGQFMPSTWKLYKHRIKKISGNGTPSPFRHEDVFAGIALHLKDAYDSDACQAYGRGSQRKREKCASAQYYGGDKHWRKFLNSYAEDVLRLADEFSKSQIS